MTGYWPPEWAWFEMPPKRPSVPKTGYWPPSWAWLDTTPARPSTVPDLIAAAAATVAAIEAETATLKGQLAQLAAAVGTAPAAASS